MCKVEDPAFDDSATLTATAAHLPPLTVDLKTVK